MRGIDTKPLSFLLSMLLLGNIIFRLIAKEPTETLPTYDLTHCVNLALEQSPVLKRKQLDLEQTNITHKISRAIYDLQLSLDTDSDLGNNDADVQAGFSKSFPREIKIDGRVSRAYGDNSTMSYALTLSKKILGGGSKLESMETIDDSMLATLKSAHDLDDQLRQIKLEVTQAFYRIVRQNYTRNIQEKRLETAIKTLEHAKVREEPIDIANAQVEVPDREIALAVADRELNAGVDNLKASIGIDQDIEIEIDTKFEYKPKKVLLDVFEKAQTKRASIAKLMLDIARQKLKIKIAKERILPDLNFDLSVSDTRDASGAPTRFSPPIDSRVGLSLDWPLFARADRLRKDREEYDLKNLELQLFQAQQTLKKSLRDLIAEIEEVERSIKLQEQALEASQLGLNLFKDRWENGEISILEYIRSQNTYRNRQVQIIQQKTNYMSLLAEYEYLVGD